MSDLVKLSQEQLEDIAKANKEHLVDVMQEANRKLLNKGSVSSSEVISNIRTWSYLRLMYGPEAAKYFEEKGWISIATAKKYRSEWLGENTCIVGMHDDARGFIFLAEPKQEDLEK